MATNKIDWSNYTIKDIQDASKQERYKAVSLFSGIGGACMGIKLSGGKVLACNEFIENARKAYSANFPDVPIIPNDIRELSGEDIMKIAGVKKGELDLLAGSPPCSSFSTVGKREEGWEEVKAYSDTKQRTDDLFDHFARVLKEIQPRYFIAENVASLLEGKAKYMFGSSQLDMFGNETNGVKTQSETIFHQLVNAGYEVDYRVINSKDYGVPQSRARLIIVGVRNDIKQKIKFPLPTTPRHITLGEAFKDVLNSDFELNEANIEKYAIYQASKDTEPGAKSEKYFSLIKQSPDKYAGTLTQTAGCLSAASIVHWEDRKFTVKEATIIMGFPKDIYLGDTYPNKLERLGRAITPSVYCEVLNMLIK